jgi:hypothetical protein
MHFTFCYTEYNKMFSDYLIIIESEEVCVE